jgi:hypothetical protein
MATAPTGAKATLSDARASASASFLRGHLAVFFGMIMRGSPRSRDALLSALPASLGDSHYSKVSELVGAAEEFVNFYNQVEEDNDSQSQQAGGDKRKREGGSAAEALEFLCDLREEV